MNIHRRTRPSDRQITVAPLGHPHVQNNPQVSIRFEIIVGHGGREGGDTYACRKKRVFRKNARVAHEYRPSSLGFPVRVRLYRPGSLSARFPLVLQSVRCARKRNDYAPGLRPKTVHNPRPANGKTRLRHTRRLRRTTWRNASMPRCAMHDSTVIRSEIRYKCRGKKEFRSKLVRNNWIHNARNSISFFKKRKQPIVGFRAKEIER